MVAVDRRFGSINKFGDTNTFGASSFESYFAWGLEVDWDGDGVFDGSNQSRYLCGFRISRGRKAMLQSSGQGFEVIPIGRATFTLHNTDGRFDGWNEDSPLYPNVTFERDVRFRVRDMVGSGGVEPVFFGEITDIVPTGYDTIDPKVNIEVSDAMGFLRSYSARVAMQQDVTLDTAIGLVLDSVSFPSRWERDLDVTADAIKYWWASGDRTAASELEDLALAGFGQFFITADGKARFITRTNVGTSLANFSQGDLYKDIDNPQPWVNRRNIMRLKVHPKDVSGTALVYEYFGTAPQIAAGETFVFFPNYTYNGVSVPALSIVTPVAGTDYQLWTTSSEGSGTDKTNDCDVTVTNFGSTALVRIVNNSGVTVYLTSFKLRGVVVYEKNAADLTYPSDPTTVTKPREFFIDLTWQQDANQAQDYVNIYGPFLDALHPFPVIKVENNFALQFGIDLFDVVTLTSDRLGIQGVAFRVGGIEHESLDENCQRVLTTFYLEPYVASGDYGSFPLTWGESTFGW